MLFVVIFNDEREREGGREEGREGGRKGGREGGRERGRELTTLYLTSIHDAQKKSNQVQDQSPGICFSI